jgi:hypothetical protein
MASAKLARKPKNQKLIKPGGKRPWPVKSHPGRLERYQVHEPIVKFHATCLKYPSQAILFHVPNGEKRDPVTASILTGITASARAALPEEDALRPYGMGVLPGVSDFVLLLPGPRTIFVEVKIPESPEHTGGTLSKTQRRFRDGIEKLGHTYRVVRSVEEYAALLEEFGVELRARFGKSFNNTAPSEPFE